jgi:hypothetical protein
VAVDDGLTDLWNARDGGVAGEILLDGVDRGILDVLRGGEVRFPCAKVGQVNPLGLHL